jgi:hypothetical protein
MKPLNIPFIEDRISQAHKQFLDSVGEMPNKLTADHKLFLTRMTTRVEAILKCFVNAGVIDNFKRELQRSDGDDSCCVFKLSTLKTFNKG